MVNFSNILFYNLKSIRFFVTVVHGGLYVFHSLDVPANQNPVENLCWRITNGKLEMTQNCQVVSVVNEIITYLTVVGC